MAAKNHLRKPENWEVFEDLCKKLWGEIWDCQEVKKSGRKGQSQNGVDLYGIPKGAKSYYGIQCKVKDEYSHKQLTTNEIDYEIDLAKSFQPPLAKLYFATTANKNAKIEEYIRIKDKENRKNELFEVHLFSWEDIVDLIDENKNTHDWYLNLNKFKLKSDVEVCFENDQNELIKLVPFCEQHIHFQLGSKPSSISDYTNYKPQLTKNPLFKGENKSYCKFKIKIKNIGSATIENPKLIFNIIGDYEEVGNEFIASIIEPANVNTDIEIHEEQGSFFICPHRKKLVPEEEYITNLICIKPKKEGGNIELRWKLISNDFKKEGVLKIKINTCFIQRQVNEYVDFRQHVRVEKRIIDYFEENE